MGRLDIVRRMCYFQCMQKNAELLKEIYSMSGQIWDMKPWKQLYETDVFGVRIPGTDRIYFISVMGSEGEFVALSAYKGFRGLYQFHEFLENAQSMRPETIQIIPHIMLSYCIWDELSDLQKESYRISGFTFGDTASWPRLDEIEPAYFPELPGGDSLSDVKVLLEQVIQVLPGAIRDKSILHREHEANNEILVRRASGTAGNLTWKDTYEPEVSEESFVEYKLKYSKEGVDAVSKLPEARAVLQLDLFMLPNQVLEKGKRGFFPFALLILDKNRGVVPCMQTLSPEPDLHSMYELLPQMVLDEIKKLGYRPTRFEVRAGIPFTLLEEPLKQANCRVLQVKRMPRMDEMAESLISHLNTGGPDPIN